MTDTTGPAISRLVLREPRDRHDRLRAAIYEPLLSPLEQLVFAELRRRALAGLAGRGVEVGIGTGLSLRHYPLGVELVGVEPLPAMAAIAMAKPTTPLVGVVTARAETLPFADHVFDFAVGHFVLCSVDDVTGALAELHRVLHPGGEVALVEHVRSSTNCLGIVQDRLAPWWSDFAYGCRLNGSIDADLDASAFHDLQVDQLAAGTLRLVRGVA